MSDTARELAERMASYIVVESDLPQTEAEAGGAAIRAVLKENERLRAELNEGLLQDLIDNFEWHFDGEPSKN